MILPHIRKLNRRLWQMLAREYKRQQETIELIPSENFASPAVLEAQGSLLTNKYAEGYPGKRYYPGNQYIDEVERFAQEQALKAFRLSPALWHVNVQPYSGSPANLAVYFALLNFGDTIMGMTLSHGGHLTHGHSVNFSGKAYRVVQYGVDEKTGRLDYEEIAKLVRKHRPKLIVSGATAYPRKIDFKKFGAIAQSVGAYHMADIAHIAGIIAAGLHPSPFPSSDIVTTTTQKTLRGPRAGVIFSRKDLAVSIDKAVFPGMQGGPHEHVIAAQAVCFLEAQRPAFRAYQRQVLKNARTLAQALARYGFQLLSRGTDTHLLLVDLRNKGIGGSDAEKILEEAGLIANRNTIPGDPSPFRPSGIRMGTPAVTTRGFGEREIKMIARWIYELLDERRSPAKVHREVVMLTRRFPVPGLPR